MQDTRDRADVATGGCQCGAVRYAIRSAVADWDCNLCHCRMCQKAGGGPFMVFVNVARESVAWNGERAIFASSSVAGRGFCPAFGTPLTYERTPTRISIAHGTLDAPPIVEPRSQLVGKARLPWSDHVAGLRVEPLGDWLTSLPAPIQSHQHPDRDA
jgi:hypothetical protein